MAVGTLNLPPKYFFVKRNTTFTVDDYLKEQNQYWYPKIYKKNNPKYLKIFKDKIQSKKKIFYNMKNIKNEDDTAGMLIARRSGISKFLGIDEKKNKFL